MKTLFVAALALVSLSASASAMDCEKEFRVRLDKMMAPPAVPTGDMVVTTRYMLQGYEACMKGDMASAKDFFARAGRSGG